MEDSAAFHLRSSPPKGWRKKHPAPYTNQLLPLIAEVLKEYEISDVFDPMAGTGKIGRIRQFGYSGKIICNDLEDWGEERDRFLVDRWEFGDAANISWAADGSVSAIVTSPTYGNRMADTYSDRSRRITYSARLGRPLAQENTGAMQWGFAYRDKHTQIWAECYRILRPGGLFILNVSDHIRGGKIVAVSRWHRLCLGSFGLELRNTYFVHTPRMRFGANSDLRTNHEYIYVFQKEG
jgi:hypothetical protein